MRVFQVLKGDVLIINDKLEYHDTVDNFKLDSGLAVPSDKIIYDDFQECCVIRVENEEGEKTDEFHVFPNAAFDEYIDRVQEFIDKKNERTPEPEPPELTEEEKIQNEANTAKSKIDKIVKKSMLSIFTGASMTDYVDEYNAELTSISDNASLLMVDYFPVWSVEYAGYAVGDKVQYNGVLYKVLQAHTPQASWTPTDAPSLFAKVLTSETGEPLPWEQPNSTNPYMTGDKVTYNGKVYESTIDNNVWSPDAYPQGWKEVE